MTANPPEAPVVPEAAQPALVVLPFDFAPATRIPHPGTGSQIFGRLLQMQSKHDTVPAGEIYLPAGRHTGVNRGFGVVHIWAEHEEQLKNLGYATIHDVARFVGDIIQSGAAVHCEFGRATTYRPVVLRSKLGQVILEQRSRDRFDTLGTSYYNVVTAFGGANVHGIRIGSVE